MLLLPSPPDMGSLDGMVQTVEVLQGAGIAPSHYAVLLTMVRPGNERKLSDARAALDDANIPMLRQTIRLSEAFRDASVAGSLVRDVKGNSLAKSLWGEYERATAEVVALTEVNR